MRPLSRHFAEIHGVDVSDEMIRLARRAAARHAQRAPASQLGLGPGAVSRREVRFRLLLRRLPAHPQPRSGVPIPARGAARAQDRAASCAARSTACRAQRRAVRHLERRAHRRPRRSREFAREHDFQLLALEQIWTQYMWVTCRKMPAGWTAVAGAAADWPRGDSQHQQRAHRRGGGAGHRAAGRALAVDRRSAGRIAT